MSQLRRWLLLTVWLILNGACLVRGGPLEGKAQSTPAKEQQAHTDLSGDPLPAAAVARLGTVRLRHSGEVGSVAFSPDGKLVASAASWNTSVWEAATGQELSRFEGKIRAEIVAFSLDGKVLLAGTQNGTIQHWDVDTGKLLQESKAEPQAGGRFRAWSSVFSPDRKLVALTDFSDNAVVLEVITGKRLLHLKKEQDMGGVAVAHDGKTLATGGMKGNVRLWDIATGRELQELKGHEQKLGIGSLLFSPDDRLLAWAYGKQLQLWEIATGKLLWVTPEGGGRIAFSPDGKVLASGHRDTICLWDVSTGQQLRQLKGHGSWLIPDLTFSADGKLLASGSRDHTVELWDGATGKPLHQFPGHRGAVVCLAFSPDGQQLASGGDEDHTLIVWDVAARKPLHFFSNHYSNAVSVAYSPDGKIIATGEGARAQSDQEAQIRLWDAREGKLLRQFTGHLNNVQSLSFSPDGKTLASAGWDARAKLWDVATGQRQHQLRGAAYDKFVAFSPDGKGLLVSDNGLALWQVDTGKKLRDLVPVEAESGRVLYAAFLPDGKAVLVVEEFSVPSEKDPGKDPGGHKLAVEVRLRDVQTARLLRSFRAAISDHVTRSISLSRSIALSPDGKTLAAITDDHLAPTVRLWDTDSGKKLAELRGHTGYIVSLAFSPDSKTLASGSWDTTVLLWDVPRVRLVGLWFGLAGDRAEGAAAAKALAADPEGAVPFLRERLRQAVAMEAPYARFIADLDSERFAIREEASRRLEADATAAEFALRLAVEGDSSLEVQRRARQALEKLTATREEQVARLVAELNREGAPQAVQQLQAMGLAAEPALRRVLEQGPFPLPGKKPGALTPGARWFVEQALGRLKEPDSSSLPLTAASVLRALSVLEQIGTPEARQALQELAKGPPESRLAREAKAALERLSKRDKQP